MQNGEYGRRDVSKGAIVTQFHIVGSIRNKMKRHRVGIGEIAGFTIVAMVQEIMTLIANRKVELKDLLLMFIYAEVLGMLGAFYARQKILIAIPLFIAMTALARLIILQGKEANPVVLIFESGAILLIAIACWIVSRMRHEE